MQTAVNPQTGETAVLVGDKWQKAEHVAKDANGNAAYFVGGQWMTDQGPSNLPAPASNKPTFRDKVLASAPYQTLRGLADPAIGLAQLFGRGAEAATSLGGVLPNPVSEYFARENAELDKYIKGSEAEILEARKKTQAPTLSGLVTGQQPDPGMSGWRFAGNVASPVNWGIGKLLPIQSGATAAKTALTAAKAGAAAGATQTVEDTDTGYWGKKAVQTGLGAATSAATAPLLNKVTQAVIPRVNALISKFTEAGARQGAQASRETDQLIAQALKEVGQNAEDLPAAYMQQLKQQVVTALKAGKKLDPATMMRADDFKALGIVPTKGQVTRDATQFALERNIRGTEAGRPLMDRFTAQNQKLAELLRSGNPQEAFQAGELISGTLKKADEGMRKQVSSMYQAARQEAGKDANVPLQGLAQDAAAVIEDFGEKVPGAVKSRLASFGILGGKQTKVYTPEEADKLLKLINEHVGSDAPTNRALDRLRAAVKRTMTDGAVDDVFAPAREAAAKRFKLQDLIPALDDAAQGRTAPDDFVKRFVVQGKAKDVQGMVELLRQTNPEAAAEAKKQVASVLERAAFGENAAGDKIFSPERFARALRNIGTEKLKAFYTPQEIEQFSRISRVGTYINSTPTAAPVSTSNSGVPVVNALMKVTPKASTASAILAPVLNSVKNTRAVNDALSNVGPVSSANITPEQARILARLLSSSSVAGGVLGASAVQ